MSGQILVHTATVTPRVRYMFGLLGERLGLQFGLTDSRDAFVQASGPKLSYGTERTPNVLHFHAHGLLAESGIRPVRPEVITDGQGRILVFPCDEHLGELPFDPFAAAFFLVSRYEEFLPHATDSLGRYDATQSTAFKHGFLDIPVVDQWVLLLREILLRHFPQLQVQLPKYRFTSTIDVDNAFAYRHKGFLVNVGGVIRSAVQLGPVAERLRVWLGNAPDPYDTFDFLKEEHARYGADAHFFYLLGDRSTYDRNLSHTNAALRTVVLQTATWAQVGIHPSFLSNAEPHRVSMEASRLESILQRPVHSSRQHFIKLTFPDTYRELARAGITDDYSMGYPTHLGFRASTSDAFRFYDLERETALPLLIHPFCCMDVTLRQYLGLTPEAAMAAVEALVGSIREVGGHFIPLWHNETVRDSGEWAGWREVFLHALRSGTA
jgi:hypothetical protein